MIRKTLVVLIALFMLVSTMSFLDARQGPDRRDMMKRGRFGVRMAERNMFPSHVLLKMKDKIQLTEDQVAKIEGMERTFEEYRIRAGADIDIMELKLRDYLKGDKVKRSEVEKLVRKVSGLKTDMQVAHINHLLDLKELLTPEQITKIEDVKKNMRKHMMEDRFRHHNERRIPQDKMD